MEKQHILQKTSVVVLLATFAAFLWGSASPTIKTGYALFSIAGSDYASQILFAGIRFTIAGILIITTVSIQEKKLCIFKPQNWRIVLLLAIEIHRYNTFSSI